LLVSLLALGLSASACSCEAELPELPARALGGSITQVEAANPEGGSSATASGSDLSVPPRDGDLGWWVQIAVSKQGVIHLVYTDAYNGELHHATRLGSEWKIDIVDHAGAVGKYPALALDDQGRPHILYYNQDRQRLFYATEVGEGVQQKGIDRRRPFKALSNWLYEIVDDGQEVGMAGRILSSSDGSLDALYYRSDEKLVHVHRDPSELGEHRIWKHAMVDDKAGGSHSIVTGFARGVDGSLHASYANWTVFDSTLRYARRDPHTGRWTHEDLPLGENVGWKSSLLLYPDANNQEAPLIAYLALRTRRIFVATRDVAGAWSSIPLVADANTFSMVKERDGDISLAYEYLPGAGFETARVRVLHHPHDRPLSEGWTLGDLGKRGTMASYLDADALPASGSVVAFYDGNIRGVKVWWMRDSWQSASAKPALPEATDLPPGQAPKKATHP